MANDLRISNPSADLEDEKEKTTKKRGEEVGEVSYPNYCEWMNWKFILEWNYFAGTSIADQEYLTCIIISRHVFLCVSMLTPSRTTKNTWQLSVDVFRI